MLENEESIKDYVSCANVNPANMHKLNQAHIVTNLKNQVYQYKSLLVSREDELKTLKANSKAGKLFDLDAKLKSTLMELNSLKNKYQELNTNFNE